MRGAERVVFAFGALGEAGQSAALAQRADAVAPAGQNLVRIGLMADVPDQPVGRRVEDVVQRDGEFDHAKPGAEMAAGLGDRVDGFLPQFVGKLGKLLRRQVFHVARYQDAIEQGGLGVLGQNVTPQQGRGLPDGLHQLCIAAAIRPQGLNAVCFSP